MADEVNHIEKINDIIRAVTEEATFSSGAMKQFIALKDEVEEQERTIKYLRQSNKDKDLALTEAERAGKILMSDKNGLAEELAHYHERESQLQDREMQCSVNEVRMECESQRVVDHQNMVGLIFRNTELRKTSFGQELTHQPGSPEMKDQYGNIQQYHTPAGFEATPVKKDEVEKQE